MKENNLVWTVALCSVYLTALAIVVIPSGADGVVSAGRVLAPIEAAEVEQDLVPPQCEDSVDLPWRCYVAAYSEVAQVLQSLEDDCFDIHTLGVAPWRLGPVETDGTRYVVEYLVTGRRLDKPCP
jgi:hypothetical protein